MSSVCARRLFLRQGGVAHHLLTIYGETSLSLEAAE
jgi:hypothetical protein